MRFVFLWWVSVCGGRVWVSSQAAVLSVSDFDRIPTLGEQVLGRVPSYLAYARGSGIEASTYTCLETWTPAPPPWFRPFPREPSPFSTVPISPCRPLQLAERPEPPGYFPTQQPLPVIWVISSNLVSPLLCLLRPYPSCGISLVRNNSGCRCYISCSWLHSATWQRLWPLY